MRFLICFVIALTCVSCAERKVDTGISGVELDMSDMDHEERIATQEEIARRQEEQIEKQERELEDLERQEFHNRQFRRFETE